MSSLHALSILAAILITNAAHGATWITEEQDDWTFECPPNTAIKDLVSDFVSSDRLWNITCAPTKPFINISECTWTNYWNAPQYSFLFECPKNSILAGISSFYQSNDRVFKFYCCMNENYLAHACKYTRNLNNYKGFMSFRTPESTYIRGFYTIYDSTNSDRLYYVHMCQLDQVDAIHVCQIRDVMIRREDVNENQTTLPMLEGDTTAIPTRHDLFTTLLSGEVEDE